MAAQFTFQSYSVTINNGDPIKFVMGANRNRVAVIVASECPPANAGNFGGTIAKDSPVGWWALTVRDTKSFTYRDFGPIIQEEWWVATNTNSVKVLLTEIVRVPQRT
jgi:hypothetical protein